VLKARLLIIETKKELDNQLKILAARAANNELSIQQRRDALTAEQKLLDDALKNNVLSVEAFNAKSKELTDARIALDNAETKNKIDSAKAIGDALGTLSDLVGKQTAAGKALGVASATINTFVGATEVLRAKSVLPEPIGTISKIVNVAAIIASGIKSIKSIVATKVPGGGGGGGSNVPSAPSPTQIQAPIAPTLASTLINQGQVNQIGSAAARAYVVESDVSGNQERIQRINRAARIS